MADIGSRNTVILLGYLALDPELQKNINTQSYFCTLRVATMEYFRAKDGKKPIKKTTYHRCVVWGATATNIAKWGKKGTLVSIDGKLKRLEWKTKDGENRTRVEIGVERLTIVGGKLKHDVAEPPEENPEEDEISPEKEKKKDDDPY